MSRWTDSGAKEYGAVGWLFLYLARARLQPPTHFVRTRRAGRMPSHLPDILAKVS